jgi:hypothetical protein
MQTFKYVFVISDKNAQSRRVPNILNLDLNDDRTAKTAIIFIYVHLAGTTAIRKMYYVIIQSCLILYKTHQSIFREIVHLQNESS